MIGEAWNFLGFLSVFGLYAVLLFWNELSLFSCAITFLEEETGTDISVSSKEIGNLKIKTKNEFKVQKGCKYRIFEVQIESDTKSGIEYMVEPK